MLAVGVSERTSPAGVERLARQVFAAGLAHCVLAVPIGGSDAGHLDTICTVVDTGVVVMHPALAYTLTAHTITQRDEQLRVSRPQPFLAAAAQAIGLDRLTVIGTALDPVTASHGQWDDGGNALSLGRGLVVCDERNRETNDRLAAAGVQVVTVPASELGSGRGGPRCLSCVIAREPAGQRAPAPDQPAPDLVGQPWPAAHAPAGARGQRPARAAGGRPLCPRPVSGRRAGPVRLSAGGRPPRPGC